MTNDLATDDRITALGLLAEVYTGLMSRLSPQIAEHRLAPVEFEVLIRLSRSPEGQLRMTDLSTQTGLTTSGVTRVVDRLERAGLVCRRACQSDRRSWYATITTDGLARIEAILPGHVELIERWFTGRLRPAQLEALVDALRVIREAVRPGAAAVGSPGGSSPAAEPSM